ncbi:MAG: YbaB/EbfC family nucleoid-associated protein [Actinomycetia bacterium]|nr:YbaB/EbfC family nucleoid-associated protein [Actinomycetes bacterium]
MNYAKMMKQMQKMQTEMGKVQDELAGQEIEASAGGGMVTAVVNGKQELLKIEIKPEAVDPEDVELLQDMVLAAVNEALRQTQELANKKMGALTGGLGLPGL